MRHAVYLAMKWWGGYLNGEQEEAEPTATCSSLPRIDGTVSHFSPPFYPPSIWFDSIISLALPKGNESYHKRGLPIKSVRLEEKKWKIVPLSAVDVSQKRRRDSISCQSKPAAVVLPDDSLQEAKLSFIWPQLSLIFSKPAQTEVTSVHVSITDLSSMEAKAVWQNHVVKPRKHSLPPCK